jgi:hypothetical protein
LLVVFVVLVAIYVLRNTIDATSIT